MCLEGLRRSGLYHKTLVGSEYRWKRHGLYHDTFFSFFLSKRLTDDIKARPTAIL